MIFLKLYLCCTNGTKRFWSSMWKLSKDAFRYIFSNNLPTEKCFSANLWQADGHSRYDFLLTDVQTS